MIETERETQELENPHLFFKDLRLVSAELAMGFGLQVEGPIFVSPDINKETRCGECLVYYKPLYYQTNCLVKAHHIHKDQGGIYYNIGDWNDMFYRRKWYSGWFAILEPKNAIYDGELQGRAEQVKVKQIIALCKSKRCQLVLLDEGVLVEDDGELYPFCNLTHLDELYHGVNPRFHFKITEDGEVLFSSIEPRPQM